MDYQPFILGSYPNAADLIERTAAALAQARAGGLTRKQPSTRTLPPEDTDIVVTKTRRGAFSTTNLANYLHAYGIDSLILAGLSTSGVVLSTVSDASDHDYRILIVTDCCDDRRPTYIAS
jgi:isochorismate hydrolase